ARPSTGSWSTRSAPGRRFVPGGRVARRSGAERVDQLPVLGRAGVAELGQRLGLDLADALAGEAEAAADLVERQRAVGVEAEPEREDLALAGREVGEEGPQVLALDGGDRGLERRLRRRVLEQVAELVVPVLADGGRQRDEVGRRL